MITQVKLTEKRAAPKLLKIQTGLAGAVGNRRRTPSRASRAGQDLAALRGRQASATLTPSSGPRPTTVSPGARATRGPPSCGCSSKTRDMAARIRLLREEPDPAAVSAFHGRAPGLRRPPENTGGGGAKTAPECDQAARSWGPSAGTESRPSTQTSE